MARTGNPEDVPMTEEEWLTGTDPVALLRYLYETRKRSRRGQGKPRRLAVEFWRWQAGNLKQADSERLLAAVALADTWTETGVKPKIPARLRSFYVLGSRAWTVARETIETAVNRGSALEKPTQERKLFLLRELWGNPFRPVEVDPLWLTWNDGTIPRLVRSIHDEANYDTLPILGDALEEAGCTDPALLEHCRASQAHVRGWWVVDLLLGRS
jgi:hypothetical protein